MTDVGMAIRVAQTKAKMPTAELARQMGVKAPQVFRWRNQTDLRLSIVEQIAGIFDMTVSEFCELGR